MSSKIERWWDADRIKWYERASEMSSFQEDLSLLLREHLDKDESIIELGTGLGYQGELLSKMGYDITSYDIDEEAIARARLRTGLDIFKLSDYKDIGKTGDVVLSVFFGRLTEADNLARILKIARKRLVYVQSCHRGQRRDLNKKKDSVEKTMEFLQESGPCHSFTIHKLSFAQPLESKEDALAFITSYYGKDRIGEYMEFVTKSEDARYPLVLKNEKEFAIFDIIKESL